MAPLTLLLTSAALLLSGCDMLDSHPYDASVSGEKHLTVRNIDKIENMTRGKTSFSFAMISDTQRGYDETDEAIKCINARPEVDFVVHGGDLTEYGATREFEWSRKILDRLTKPYVCVIGNHDCLATGPEVYKSMFGDFNFSFVAGNVLFVCLNTNALEFDHSFMVPDFMFIKNVLKDLPAKVTKTVFLMHASPVSMQFDLNVAEEFQALVRQFPDVQFCLYGHGHNIAADDLFGDGIMYYQCASIKKRSYLLFTITETDYDYKVVQF